MPNGGSDNCGTCWFNRANRGQKGHVQQDPKIKPACEIRPDLTIEMQSYTYCANHPRHARERLAAPIGPVWVDRGSGRELFQDAPDSEAVRAQLLALLERIEMTPPPEYPIGMSLEEAVVRQLGALGEKRAIPGLQRIVAFREQWKLKVAFPQSRESLAEAAHQALKRIGGP